MNFIFFTRKATSWGILLFLPCQTFFMSLGYDGNMISIA